jgi:hypothetical protein
MRVHMRLLVAQDRHAHPLYRAQLAQRLARSLHVCHEPAELGGWHCAEVLEMLVRRHQQPTWKPSVVVKTQRRRPLTNVSGEYLSLSLAGSLFDSIPTCVGIGDRQVFPNSETGVVGILDGIHHSALRGADITGTTSCNRCCLTQLVSLAHHHHLVGVRPLVQRIGAVPIPWQSTRLLPNLHERVLPPVSGSRPMVRGVGQVIDIPCPNRRQRWQSRSQHVRLTAIR